VMSRGCGVCVSAIEDSMDEYFSTQFGRSLC
jgi:hypothetical protein